LLELFYIISKKKLRLFYSDDSDVTSKVANLQN